MKDSKPKLPVAEAKPAMFNVMIAFHDGQRGRAAAKLGEADGECRRQIGNARNIQTLAGEDINAGRGKGDARDPVQTGVARRRFQGIGRGIAARRRFDHQIQAGVVDGQVRRRRPEHDGQAGTRDCQEGRSPAGELLEVELAGDRNEVGQAEGKIARDVGHRARARAQAAEIERHASARRRQGNPRDRGGVEAVARLDAQSGRTEGESGNSAQAIRAAVDDQGIHARRPARSRLDEQPEAAPDRAHADAPGARGGVDVGGGDGESAPAAQREFGKAEVRRNRGEGSDRERQSLGEHRLRVGGEAQVNRSTAHVDRGVDRACRVAAQLDLPGADAEGPGRQADQARRAARVERVSRAARRGIDGEGQRAIGDLEADRAHADEGLQASRADQPGRGAAGARRRGVSECGVRGAEVGEAGNIEVEGGEGSG